MYIYIYVYILKYIYMYVYIYIYLSIYIYISIYIYMYISYLQLCMQNIRSVFPWEDHPCTQVEILQSYARETSSDCREPKASGGNRDTRRTFQSLFKKWECLRMGTPKNVPLFTENDKQLVFMGSTTFSDKPKSKNGMPARLHHSDPLARPRRVFGETLWSPMPIS